MAGMLLNNILYYIEIDRRISYILDFTIGNSIINTFLIYICSYVFNFCVWHRLIITANIVNLIIANVDVIVGLPVSDIQLLIIYHIVAVTFIVIATVNHIHNKKK